MISSFSFESFINDNSTFIIDQGNYVSFATCFTVAKKLGEYLHCMGVKPGHNVGILLSPCKEYFFLFLALMQIKAVVVPINTYFRDEEIIFALDKVSSRFLITNQTKVFSHSCATISTADIPWNSFQEDTSGACFNIDVSQPTTIVFTSGSSGAPKAVVHSFANHYFSALGSNQHIPLTSKDKWLLSLPLYHVAGIAIFFRCLIAKATIVIGGKNIPLEITKYQITHVSLVAAQLYDLLNQDTSKLCSLQHILLGGSSFSFMLLKKALQQNLGIYMSYGLTEMSSQVATTTKIEHEEDTQRAQILPYRKVKIVDGQILVSGETLCLGYLQDDQILDIRDQGGWFATKDLGVIDEKDILQVFGRKDNMFISGGENIHPQEIEQKLCTFPGITQAVVVPVTNKKYGFRPFAFVLSDNEIDESKIKAFLREKIASFKVPDYIYPWPLNVPQTGIKINRKNFAKVAEEYARDHEASI